MESKNKTVLMTVIDTILEETVWVNKSGETISLKDAIAKNIKMGNAGNIESLDRSKPIHVIAQNAQTCVVYGMPRAVAEAGLVDEVVPLESIANTIIKNVGVK